MRPTLFTSALCLTSLALASTASAQFGTPTKRATTKALPLIPPPPSGSSFLVAGGSDDCASAAAADAISGTGTFSVVTTGATNGAPAGSCGGIGNDVWFYWTATTTGSATVSLCGSGSGADTVLAAWADGSPAGTCPTTQITCNDDTCGLESQVTFPVVAGTSYFLEFGEYFGGATYTGNFTIAVTGGGAAGDDCASPLAITGVGAFPFTNVGATTGAEGQGETACLAFGTTGITTDIWHTWTAPSSGLATMSLCGGTTIDSKIAAYAGAGCPAGSALACNDDTCGLQSQIDFAVVAGQSYTLQLGNYPGAATGSGTFTIGIVSPDDCATPTPISGTGTFAFDNSTATTGAQGQTEAGCLFFGTSGITNDIWFSWTGTATGTATLSLCGGTTMDSKVAVYDGTGCPAASALACNDDSCGLQSQLTFAAVIGQPYTIQLGNYPGAGGSAGTFTLNVAVPPSTGCQHDDGTSENSVGLTAGGDLVWLNKFGAAGNTAIVPSISAAYGTPVFPGSGLDGSPVTLVIWDDANDDGNPNDLVLLATVGSTIAAADTDTFVSGSFASPVVVQGVYFVGVLITHAPGQYPAALDQSQASLGRSWVAGGAAGSVNLANLNGAQIPPTDMDGIGLPGLWLVRADCSDTTGTTVCEGTMALCPCGNGGAPGHGCGNSFNADGANLIATGSSTLGNDTLVLHASGMSAASAPSWVTFAQASTLATPFTFGDGLSCLSGSLIRLGTRPIVGGASDFGHGIGSDPDISVQGLVNGPGTRHYQAVYRNAMPFCTADTFNITNGVSIVWN